MHDPEPTRSPVKILAVNLDNGAITDTEEQEEDDERKKKKKVQLNFRSGKKVVVDEDGNVRKGVTKGGQFQTERKLRGDSRHNYVSGMHRHAWCFKTVTDDEVFCATRSKEKGTEGAWTTSKDFTFIRAGGTTLPTPPPPPPPASAIPGPSFANLARNSPSKSMAKPTARKGLERGSK